MKKLILTFFTFLMVVCFAQIGSASSLSELYDWAFNIDGVTSEYALGDSMPTTGVLSDKGIGTLTWSTSAAGDHNFIAFFDHQFDVLGNTFFNEYGDSTGTLAAGQSWEIDEPGYVFGDIFANFFAGALDNSNAVPSGSDDDVSWAMGWDFTLLADETATINLILADIAPGAGFYMSQTDPDSGETIYFSSTLTITGGGETPVPEPSTMLLFGIGTLGLAAVSRRKKQ